MTKLTFSKNQGFFLKKSLLDKVETSFLQRTPKSNTDLQQKSHTGKDKDNRNVLLAIWTNPGVSVYGTIARIKSVVDSMEKILGGELYHLHSKIIFKDPNEGGSWEWASGLWLLLK